MMRGSFFFLSFTALLFVMPLVSSFGVSAPYWEDNPLVLAPGEQAEVRLKLQNMVGAEDIVLQATISSEGEIAMLLDSSSLYTVPRGTEDVIVPVRVTIPSDAVPGSVQRVSLTFVQVAGADEGTVQVAGAFSTSFPVQIMAHAQDSSRPWSLLPLVIVVGIVGFVIFVIMRSRSKRTKST